MKLISKSHPDKQPTKKVITSLDDIELPEGLYLRVRAICRNCGNTYTYDGDIKDFDQDMSYCGRTYRCLP